MSSHTNEYTTICPPIPLGPRSTVYLHGFLAHNVRRQGNRVQNQALGGDHKGLKSLGRKAVPVRVRLRADWSMRSNQTNYIAFPSEHSPGIRIGASSPHLRNSYAIGAGCCGTKSA